MLLSGLFGLFKTSAEQHRRNVGKHCLHMHLQIEQFRLKIIAEKKHLLQLQISH